MEKDFENFIQKYKDRITNIPTIDDVAEFYLARMDEIDFSDIDKTYDYLSDVRETNADEGDLLFSASEMDQNLVTPFISCKSQGNRPFVLFSNSFYEMYYHEDNQLKLWINAKLENLPEIAFELADMIQAKMFKFKDTRIQPDITQFKISNGLHRNDSLTIYTDYFYADLIIQDLKELKEKRPELFESESKPNPFLMKIDDFISYADVNHDSSFPILLADIYCKVNAHRNEILSLPADKRKDFVKSHILNAMIGDLSSNKRTILANPQNMASTRTSDGVLIKDLSQEDRDKYVASLNKMQTKLLEKSESNKRL